MYMVLIMRVIVPECCPSHPQRLVAKGIDNAFDHEYYQEPHPLVGNFMNTNIMNALKCRTLATKMCLHACIHLSINKKITLNIYN